MLQAPLYVSKYPADSFRVKLQGRQWDRHHHVWGDPDTGKTQWALAQFERPHYVRYIDYLICN